MKHADPLSAYILALSRYCNASDVVQKRRSDGATPTAAELQLADDTRVICRAARSSYFSIRDSNDAETTSRGKTDFDSLRNGYAAAAVAHQKCVVALIDAATSDVAVSPLVLADEQRAMHALQEARDLFRFAIHHPP